MLRWAAGSENDEFYELLWEYGAVGYGGDCEVPETASGCSTVDGEVVDAQCVFPFTHQGITYCGCNADYADEIWCSTKTDHMGRHVTGNWGVCSEECPIA